MVSSRRGLRNPSPIFNYADEKEGLPSTALLSDFGRAFGDIFLTHQLCKEGWSLTSLPGWQPYEEMDTGLVISGLWAVLWDAILQGRLGMGRAVSDAEGLQLLLTVRETPCGLGMVYWALLPSQYLVGTWRP